MPKPFQLKSSFLNGYRNKADVTNLPPGTLVSGSQNVLSNDGDDIDSSRVYTSDGGEAEGSKYPIIASYEWKTNRGVEHALRRYHDKLEVRFGNAWHTLKNGLAMSGVNKVMSQFAEFWDNDQKVDALLVTD